MYAVSLEYCVCVTNTLYTAQTAVRTWPGYLSCGTDYIDLFASSQRFPMGRQLVCLQCIIVEQAWRRRALACAKSADAHALFLIQFDI